MKKPALNLKKRWFSITVCILTAALLLQLPGLFRRAAQPAPVPESLQNSQSGWGGVLRLWEIPSVRTGKGDSTAFLRNRIAAFEKANPGVFIDIRVLSATQAHTLLQKAQAGEGYLPDMISYGAGFFDDPSAWLQEAADPLPDNLHPSLLTAARYEGSVYGIPYLFSGYALIARSDALSTAGVTLEPWDAADWAQTLIALSGEKPNPDRPRDKIPIRGLEAGSKGGSANFALAVAAREGEGVACPAEGLHEEGLGGGQDKAMERLLSGQTAMMAGGLGEMQTLIKKAEEVESPIALSCQLLRAPDGSIFTDQMQLLALMKGGQDEGRNETAGRFVEFVLNRDSQAICTKVGGFAAVVPPSAGFYEQEDPLYAFEQALREGKLLTVPAYDYDAQRKADFDGAGITALTGEDADKVAFGELYEGLIGLQTPH